MEVELTEEEQKIYDNLVKFTSGEYRDTERHIFMECFGTIFVSSDIFGSFSSWAQSSKKFIKNIEGVRFICVENWREVLKTDFYEAFLSRFLVKSAPNLKVDPVKPNQDPGAVAFYRRIANWGENIQFEFEEVHETVERKTRKGEKLPVPWSTLQDIYVNFDNFEGTIKVKVNLIEDWIEKVEYRFNRRVEINAIHTDEYIKVKDFYKLCIENVVGSVEFKNRLISTKKLIVSNEGSPDNIGLKTDYEFLLDAYVGTLKYGSPENYLKQVIASRKAV
jgi:hypothetical protein